MSLTQIFGALHFLEAADCPIEFEPAVARRVKSRWCRVRRGKQFHPMLVQRVDQGYETCGFIAHFAGHYRDSDNDHGVEAAGNCQIVSCAPGLAAQPLEGEDGHALEALRDVQHAAATDVQLFRRDRRAIFDRMVGELEKAALSFSVASGPLGTSQVSSPRIRSSR